MINNDDIVKIQKTANTLYDLRDHTDVPFCKEISDFLMQKTNNFDQERISTENFQTLPVSRFLTNHKVLEFFADKYGDNLQVIELGSGFTPHFLNLKSDICKYVEVELEVNATLKEEITNKLTKKDNIFFVKGDILLKDTWLDINKTIDNSKPVLIFSEGVIAQYFSAEQKNTIGQYINEIINNKQTVFMVDDTLRNHPEFFDNKIIREGMNRISNQSGSKVYNKEESSFEIEIDRWSKIFNYNIETVNYFLGKPEMDFVLKEFKLILCISNNIENYKIDLLNLSEEIKNKRIWK